MKKTISLLLAFVMLFSIVSINFTAFASEGSVSIDVKQLNANMPTLGGIRSSSTSSYNGVLYYSDGRELYNIARSAMENRKTSFKLRYYYPDGFYYQSSLYNKVSEILMYAWSDDMSISSIDGDYIHWSVSALDLDYYSPRTGYYDLTLKIGYYNNNAQEKAVDTAVYNIVSNIRSKNWSDYKILKYIHDYICNRTTYCYEALDRPNAYKTAFSAYGALVGGRCVCQGYAIAYYRICRELGYDVRFVYSDPIRGNHAWNMIRLDNKTYYIDCTWDDNIYDDESFANEPQINGNPYYYFLVDYTTLRSLDGSSSSAHTLDDELMDDNSFVSKYYNYTATAKFNPNIGRHLSTCTESIAYTSTVYNGGTRTPRLTLTDKDGKKLVEDVDYYLTYGSNVNSGRAKVKITGMNNYSGMVSYRTYIIRPKKISAMTLESGGRSKNALALTWTNPYGGVSGYQVQMYKNGSWQNVKNVTSGNANYCNITSLSANTKYMFRVRAYKSVGRTNYYGEISPVFTVYTSPNAPTITSVSSKSKSLTTKWKTVSCSGYQLQYSTNSSLSGAKTVKLSSKTSSKTISSLKKGKKYYVRIRAYRIVNLNGKTQTYYSSWSSKKSVTIK